MVLNTCPSPVHLSTLLNKRPGLARINMDISITLTLELNRVLGPATRPAPAPATAIPSITQR